MNDININIISEGIAILILSIAEISLQTLLQAPSKMDTVEKTFLLYIAGLIGVEKKATCSKMAKKLGNISHDKLNRILKEGGTIASKIVLAFINFCISQTGGFLILDDVLISKRSSSKIEGVYNEFDTKDKEKTKGMRIVMVIWSNGVIRIPVAWAIWHKEDKTFMGLTKKGHAKYKHTGLCLLKINGVALPYKTKNQIGLELLNNVIKKGIKPEYVTFDSWYVGKMNLKSLFLAGLPCYSRLKANRKVIFEGETLSLKQLAKRFRTFTFDHKHDAYIKAIEVYLPGCGQIKLLFVRKDKHIEPGASKFILCTELQVSAPQILLRYRSRWAIETLFRDVKQNLNFEACQARLLCMQENHIAFSLFAFVVLELQPALSFNNFVFQTIGEKKEILSSLLLIKKKQKFFFLDTRNTNTIPIPLQGSSFDRVLSTLDFSFKILDYQRTEKSA